jgi:hypothetical protein
MAQWLGPAAADHRARRKCSLLRLLQTMTAPEMHGGNLCAAAPVIDLG